MQVAMSAPSRPADRRLLGMGLRVIAIALLSVMMALIKLAGERGVSLPEIMFWRQAFAIPVILVWVAMGAGIGSLRSQRLGTHARRSALGLTGMVFNFGAVLLLPLAEAVTISFTMPLFATMLAALVLKERVGPHRWSAVALGFVGVLIVVQPGDSPIPAFGAGVGLTAAIMVAIISIQVRDLARTEAPATMTFWFAAFSLPVLGLALPFFAGPHDWHGWALLAAIGAVGALGQICLSGSLVHAPVSAVIGMDYSGLIWATLFGWLIWEQLPTASTWLGAPVIVASGLYIAWREHRLSIARTPETPA